MSTPAPARNPGRKRSKVDYFKWIAGIGVPIAVALIGWIRMGHDTAKTPQGQTIVNNVQVFAAQYQQFNGQPLQDDAIKRQLQSAVNLADAKQYDASLAIYQQIADTVKIPAVYNNLGALLAAQGRKSEAQQAYQKAAAIDPSFKPLKDNLEKLQAPVATAAVAAGEDILHARPLATGAHSAGSLAANGAVFFQIHTPKEPRDIFEARITVKSPALVSGLTIFGPTREQVAAADAGTAGADCILTWSPGADSIYYVQVRSRYGTTGDYDLAVRPLKRYDRYEPNDNTAQATKVSLPATIDANIMDPGDADFYQFQSGSKAGAIGISIRNKSQSLVPGVTVFGPNKEQIAAADAQTAGADLDYSFSAAAATNYYVEVRQRYGSAGEYQLTLGR